MLGCVSQKSARRSSKLSTPCSVKSIHTMSDQPPNKQPARPKEILVKSITMKNLMEGIVLDHCDLEALMQNAHEIATKKRQGQCHIYFDVFIL